MKTTQVEQVPFLYWQTVWENYSRRLTSLDSVSEKITQEEQSPLIRRQVIKRKYSEEMTKNKIVLKLAPSPQKEKHLAYMEIAVALTKKGIFSHIKGRYEAVKIV